MSHVTSSSIRIECNAQQLGLADLVAQLFVAVVDLNAKALGAEAGCDGMAVVHLLIADRHDDGLHRGELCYVSRKWVETLPVTGRIGA